MRRSPGHPPRHITLAAAAALAASACGGASSPLRASAPAAPAGGPSRCKVAAGQESPLVTEWPASEKANLESRIREGGVAVEYSGCSMRILAQCPVKGTYAWKRTTTATDTLEIRDADELYAKLPLGAVSLEGELQRSGRIAVQTTVAGQLELRGVTPAQIAPAGACAGATHLIGALSVGSFKLRSGGALAGAIWAGASVPVVGQAGGSTRSEETVMREAGDPEACKAATDESPTVECRSPIQVFLWPLPGAQEERGPRGTVKVGFYSAQGSRTWDVKSGERTLCETPCTKWVDPAVPFGMYSEGNILNGGDILVQVPDLRAYGSGPIDVRAEGKSMAGLAGGVTMTTFGGLGTAAGIALLGYGCGVGESGVCAAGAITAPLSALLLLGPGIWLIIESGPEVHVSSPASPVARLAPRPSLGLGGVF
ncbi:MAG: hypothetical protein IT372_31170 [Polyangiaceae bacterium]|nr:hypothetical protein [Polyangiaceae bacterium]